MGGTRRARAEARKAEASRGESPDTGQDSVTGEMGKQGVKSPVRPVKDILTPLATTCQAGKSQGLSCTQVGGKGEILAFVELSPFAKGV